MATRINNYRVGVWYDVERDRRVFVIERYRAGRWWPCVMGGRPQVYRLRYDACGAMLVADTYEGGQR